MKKNTTIDYSRIAYIKMWERQKSIYVEWNDWMVNDMTLWKMNDIAEDNGHDAKILSLFDQYRPILHRKSHIMVRACGEWHRCPIEAVPALIEILENLFKDFGELTEKTIAIDPKVRNKFIKPALNISPNLKNIIGIHTNATEERILRIIKSKATPEKPGISKAVLFGQYLKIPKEYTKFLLDGLFASGKLITRKYKGKAGPETELLCLANGAMI
jgi:hypothetical protein